MEETETIQVQDSFAKEMTKSFSLSAAATVGTMAGFVLVAAVASWVRNRKNRNSPVNETLIEQNN